MGIVQPKHKNATFTSDITVKRTSRMTTPNLWGKNPRPTPGPSLGPLAEKQGYSLDTMVLRNEVGTGVGGMISDHD